MTYLYSEKSNEIDMLVDFDNKIIKFKLVNDKQNREYILTKEFKNDDNKLYTPHFNVYWQNTRIQIAKIPIQFYGKKCQIKFVPY